MRTDARPVQEWLDDLVAAEHEERLSVSMRGVEAGISFTRVRCARHGDVTLNWLSAHAHLAKTEASYRFQTGDPTARLHQAGDLSPASADKQVVVASRWSTSRCRSAKCRRTIVWAVTESGSRMPVDATADPAGTVLLTTMPGDPESTTPFAMVLHSDSARAEASAEALHTAHFATCPDAVMYRRRR